MGKDIEVVIKERMLRDIPGVGEALSKKIIEIVETGQSEYLEKLKKEIPEGVLRMLGIPGLGPKKVSAVYKHLNITTIEELKQACIHGKLRNLDGFGELTETNILRGIQLIEKTSGRALLNMAYADGNILVEYLKNCDKVKKISIAGSLRRRKETIGDIDILVSSDYSKEVMDFFVGYKNVQQIIANGSTKTSVLLTDNLQVDLRVVKPESFGSALQYFTGSKDHNIQMRNLAMKKGYKLNEYGLFDKKTDEYIVGKNEEDVYKKLGLAYVEPELRENRGEIQAAAKNQLPRLVGYDNLCGDIHIHSNWSDGFDTIETIVDQAKKMGYEYVGITDHSQSLKIARGLSKERVIKKREEINKNNKKQKDGFRVFCGTECDIKPDGTLDYPDSVLKMFDYVGIGIHTKMKMTRKEATSRIVQGMENEYVTFVAHPTCRMIGRREPFDLDMEEIFDIAKSTDTALEINSFPDRLDLNDIHCRQAKEKNVKIVINTDSHRVENMEFIRFGIATARRGWLQKDDILNTYTLKEIEKLWGV
ncbi:MAG: DNA polymerase/3'-5' exonuclease PolX [Thermoplasmata archaeon]|nr:MAG: DNA polymerase/3'-5' exonuclease PolX [Thermoplasmata archaeon]